MVKKIFLKLLLKALIGWKLMEKLVSNLMIMLIAVGGQYLQIYLPSLKNELNTMNHMEI